MLWGVWLLVSRDVGLLDGGVLGRERGWWVYGVYGDEVAMMECIHRKGVC